MNFKITKIAAACLALGLWPAAADAAVVTLNTTVDINSADHPNPSLYFWDQSDFAPFSVDISEGDLLIWTISFQPGQSLFVPNLSSTLPSLVPTTYTGLIDTFISGNGLEQQAVTFFDAAGAELGWDPGDGGKGHEATGLFNPYMYGNLEPSITFHSMEIRFKVTNYETPGVTTVNFSSAYFGVTNPNLFPGQSPQPPTRTLPSAKPAFLFPELQPPTDPNPPVTPVPEPATWAMLIAGFGLIGLGLRRRRSVTSSAG